MDRFSLLTNGPIELPNYVEFKKWIVAEIKKNLDFYKGKNLMFFLPKTNNKLPQIVGGKVFKNRTEYIEYFKRLPADTCFVGLTAELDNKVFLGINCLDFFFKAEIKNQELNTDKTHFFEEKTLTEQDSMRIKEAIRIVESKMRKDENKDPVLTYQRKWA